ncbi:MAG TPA: CoA pyrophosphatase [Gemmatimonas sp.]|uniref:NUDIX hydrolase n=1 Tax=Gemmatimonas sp. TaxID=1962908 RepID=UPI002ED960CA
MAPASEPEVGVTDRAGLSEALRGALRHRDIARLAHHLATREPQDAEQLPNMRFAAVAAVLRVVESGPELLFIKRADRDGDPWSGHMAFPGGRREPSDASLEMTAIRETSEELSLDLMQGVMLGRLDDLAPRSPSLPPIMIRPFVALVPADVTFVPNVEVAATYWVPLAMLRHPDAQAEHVMTINGARARFPGFRVDQYIVWGLTERIVTQLLPLFDP